MSATGFTPIQLYYSTTASAAPSAGNLANGELALNITDGKLYYKDNGGSVQVLATKGAGTIGGSTTQVQYNNAGALAGSANLTFDGFTLTANAALVGGTLGLVVGGALNGTTINSVGVALGGTQTLSINGGTANGVAYLNGSKVLTTGSALTFDGTNLSLLPSGYSVFGASSAEQMRLTSTGLGIGTSSPATGVHLQRSSGNTYYRAQNNLTSVDAGVDGAGTGILWNNGNYPLAFGTNNTERMRLDSAGNLGLGVTPSAWSLAGYKALQVGNGALWASTSSDTNIMANAVYSGGFKYITTLGASQYEQYNGAHYWYTAPSGTAGNAITFTQAMTLDASGNLLVGTTIAGAGAGSGRLTVESNSAAISVPVAFSDLRTDNSSSVMVYIVRKGSVVGSISTTNALTIYATTSDYRLKNNQAPLTNSGAFIDALQPKTWDWAQDGSKGVGFIAHEFAEVSPNSVSGQKDAVDADGKPMYQSMQSSSAEVIANLVAEIQSLRKRLAAAGI